VSFSFQIPWYICLAAALLGYGFSFFVYRITVPPVSRSRRYLLIALRGTALGLIILALCEPLLKLTSTRTVKPPIAVLVDNSMSMSLTDAAGSREKLLHSILRGKAFEHLSDASDLHMYSFASALKKLIPDSLRLDGAVTDIGAAISALREKEPEGLEGIVLISDGNYNAGSNPLYTAERSPFPIYTVGVGDSTEQKDLFISRINTNSIAYIKSSVPMDLVVNASGYRDKRISVTLFEEGKQIDQRPVTLSGSGEYPVRFMFTPSSDGIKRYTVRVSPLEGEVTEKNNARSVQIKVLKNKMRIVVVAGTPSADLSAVMQVIQSDPNMESALYVQQPNGLFRNQQLATVAAASLAAADGLILVGFPVKETSSGTLQFILNALATRSLPVLFLSGRTLDISKVRLLEPYLPCNFQSEKIDELTVFPSIVPAQRYHILVNPGSSSDAYPWDKLPPIYTTSSVVNAKPEADVLAVKKIQNVVLNEPLFVSRTTVRAKSFAILGYGINRWKLLAGANDETAKFFDAWFSTLLRFVQVSTVKPLFSRGESIDFFGQVYDRNYLPLDNADLRVDVSAAGINQKYTSLLPSIGGGRYEGNLSMLPEGDYSFTASASANGIEIGKTSGRFSVGDQSVEFSETKMNKPLLQQLAAVSGGTYTDAADFNALVDGLLTRPEMKPSPRTSTSEIELWNLPLLLFIIVILLGIEWFLRKRSGML
jgi:hypothetical protein